MYRFLLSVQLRNTMYVGYGFEKEEAAASSFTSICSFRPSSIPASSYSIPGILSSEIQGIS